MRPSSPAAVVLVSAFTVAAGAFTYVAVRIVGAERAAAEEEARRGLRAAVETNAQRIATAIAVAKARALTDARAIVVRDGVFVAPHEFERLEPLPDSNGRDRVGDSLLREAQRLEAEAERGDEAASIYRRLLAEKQGDDAVRRLATWRLAALLVRRGAESEAAELRARFLAELDDGSRGFVECLLARIAVPAAARSPDETRNLRIDLLAHVGGGDDAIAVALLREAGVVAADELDAEIARRGEEVKRVERLQPLLPELARRPSGARYLDEGRGAILVWTAAEDGTQRVVECEAPGFELGTAESVSFSSDARDLDRSADRLGLDSLRESRLLGDLLPDAGLGAALRRSTVEAEAQRNVRWITAALALLLVLGGGGVHFTLRAARREREAARTRTAFVARVSHDLRTPLSVIRLYAETIASGRATRPDEVREFAGVAAREAERLTVLVGQVLDFSRASARREGAGARAQEAIDVGALLAEVVDESRPAARAAGMELSLTVAGNDLRVAGDRAGLRTALVNLLVNGLTHAASGGRIEIEAGAQAGALEIRVSDRGPGLPAGLGERIFDPFVRGPQARPGGSGLGLALVREVAGAHGGRVVAQDRAGGGAVFTLVLPRAEPAA